MPGLSSQITRHAAASDSDPDLIVELSLVGLIDAANYLSFEKALARAAELEGRHLLLEFSGVEYLNSTGISAIIREHERYQQRRGSLVLVGVSREVGLSLEMLGVPSLIAIFSERKEALAQLAKGPVSPPPRPQEEEETTGDALDVPEEARGRRGLVLVLSPDRTRFTRLLKRRFEDVCSGDYHLAHDVETALALVDRLRPDLVVVDDRSDPRGEFVSRLKVQTGHSLTSVVKTYAPDSDVRGTIDFKIWENDFLVDPFDTKEFFELTEAELRRVPVDRRVFHQQVHFEFRSTPENIEKAHRLATVILKKALDREDDRTTFLAAVKEGIDNARRHGNLSQSERLIDLNFLVDQRKVTVILEDEGEGFDFEYYLSRVGSREAFEKIREKIQGDNVRGGLGILLMAKCSDQIRYFGRGNILRLEKKKQGTSQLPSS